MRMFRSAVEREDDGRAVHVLPFAIFIVFTGGDASLL